MSRKPCTDCKGNKFKKDKIDAVWKKAKKAKIKGTKKFKDSKIWKEDKYGKLIKYDHYGNTSSPYGWEIDHSNPVSKGGTDLIRNLQALYWRHNRFKGNNYPFSLAKLEKARKEFKKKVAQKASR